MPVAIERVVATPTKASEASNSGTKLRSATPQETREWSEALTARSILFGDLYDLDEAVEYPFKDQDQVWIRTKEDNWCFGRVVGRAIRVGQTRHRKQGFYYPVNFGTKQNLRKYFAPLNGEIKPNTKAVRQLLIQEGWIEDDGDSTDSSGDLYLED